MKRTIVAVAILFVTFLSTQVMAQGVKIGYTNMDYIVSQLPEARQIETELKAHNKQLENQLKAKVQEYQTKLQAYQQGAATMADAVRADKERELQSLQVSIQEFERNAQISLQKKQQELLQPVYEKVQKAIEEVSEESGYTHVFSTDAIGNPILLYAREEDNISDSVLKKLGVTPPAKSEK